ncbi:MAG: transcriptional regulator [Lysobacteraceae bacterium]|nr:MAG: transcriptional regulator [Xanthomonadaceae bacterium]
MEELNDLALFAQVVEHGGFAACERATGITRSRLSRRVAALEKALGARLLQRSSRGFAVTELGRRVHEHARAMLEQAECARNVALEHTRAPRGRVRVSCPVALAQAQLAELLPAFLSGHPEVRLHLLVSNRRFDPVADGVDVALRVRSRVDEDPGLIVRTFGRIRELLVASPGYLASHGIPAAPADLFAHAILSMQDEPGPQRWELRGDGDEIARVEFEPRVAAKDFPLLLRMALAGLGIALLPEPVCREQLARGDLVRVLPGWELPLGVCHAVYASRRGLLPAIRAFLDHLDRHLPGLLERGAQPSKPSA